MSIAVRTSLVVACLALSDQNALAVVAHPGALPGRPIVPPVHTAAIAPTSNLEVLMMLGAGSVALMLLCRLYQREVPWFAFATVVFGLIASLYGFLTGAWPLGIALAAYSIGSFRSWLSSRRRLLPRPEPARYGVVRQPWEESRMTRLFGSN